MDLKTVIARAKAILISPSEEWPEIAERTETIRGIYKDYLLIILAVPAVVGLLTGSLSQGVVSRVIWSVVSYAISLGAIYVLALIVDALAPNFGGQKNRVQAFKAVAYASTASALAGAGVIVPGIGPLIVLVGAVYTIYLLYLGLPVLMKAPREKAIGYTGLVIGSSFLLFLVLGWIVGGLAPGMRHMGGDKPMTGVLEDRAKRLEAAGKRFEEAQKSGDVEAQKQAMSEMMGGLFSGGAAVEALAPEKIQGFLPESIGNLARKDPSAERNEAMGLQMSNARATYADGAGKSLNLEIIDMGSAKGIAAAVSWAQVQQDRRTETGFERTYRSKHWLIHEQWDSATRDGEYSIILADRFTVTASGQVDSIEALRKAAESVNLKGLEKLKNEGVKKGG